jgi:hypothetical protein
MYELASCAVAFIPDTVQAACADPTVCRRSQNCDALRAWIAANPLDAAQALALQTLYTLQAERDEHRKLRLRRTAWVKTKLATLAVGEYLVAFDFSGFATAYARSTSIGEGMTGPQALMVEIYWRENGELKLRHNCVIAPAEHDHLFVRRAFLHVLGLDFMQPFKRVHFLSDGGPKHFKIKSTIFFPSCRCSTTSCWRRSRTASTRRTTTR